MNRQSHWENIYKIKSASQVSWFKPHLSKSLELISQTKIGHHEPIIDVGGGASTLVDDLSSEGFTSITVLDISSESLEVSKKRLGKEATKVHWVTDDIIAVNLPENHYSLWHDRAVFHFLTNPADRQKYKRILVRSLKPGAFAVVSSFSLSGPVKCSGLDVVRYSSETLLSEFGSDFQLLRSETENHKTPFDTVQEFVYCLFRKI